MLGSRTRQVNSYGRRRSRIVNASDRRDGDGPASDSDSHTLSPRAHAIVMSPAKPRSVLHKCKRLDRSARASPSLQPQAARNPTSKRALGPRQPLTPLRPNGASAYEHPSSGATSKPKASTLRAARASLKPRAPVIAVDIIVLDGEGNMLTQERRLSHPGIQANGTPGKSPKRLPSPQSATVNGSLDSDLEVVSPGPIAQKRARRRNVIIFSSDESENDDEISIQKMVHVPVAKSRSRSGSSRVEVVIPAVAPSRKSKVAKAPPSLPPHAQTPPRRIALPAPSRGLDPSTVSSHLAPPFPILKPRQLTPIRGHSSRSLFRRPPPTPSTPTEADLSLDFAQLNLSVATDLNDLASAQPEYLVPLLNECAQTSPYEFSAFIETFPFDPIVQSSAEDGNAKFRKIGEASYSEVFGIGDVVLKVIPIRFENESMHPEATEIPAPSGAKDVLKEIIVTREIGEICDKFVKLLKSYVVRGRYPSLLLDLWDEYNDRKGSESIRPDSFGLSQVYAIIILPNGGPDLESYAFKNASKSGWRQACGIFWQVARALEQAEYLVKFEHRDLHWGQILVKSIPVKKKSSPCTAMDDTRFGVKVTIIDLGLSRMSTVGAQGSTTYWTPFDDEIFEGEGDYQYDIYRMMRDLTGGAWRSYHPFTNVMWLHYLVTKLLREKRLKFPGGKRQAEGERQVASPTGYDEQECCDCLVEMEGLLGNCIASARKGPKARRKMAASAGVNGPKSARDVIAYGIRRGWVEQEL